MERNVILGDIAQRIGDMARRYGRRSDIDVTFCRLTAESIREFTDFQLTYNGLIEGEEYFFVWETSCLEGCGPRGLLYAVNVTGDSFLTAANELMSLVSRKF